MKVLLDTNVVLDVLLDRQPHVSSATALWAIVERGSAVGVIAAHALTTIHYLVGKDRDARVATRVVRTILRTFDVAIVDGVILRAALDLGWKDYEDAVTAAAAAAAQCDLLATRDPRGFAASTVPAFDPASALAVILAS